MPYDASGFLPGRTPGLPQPDQIVSWYREAAEWDPVPELSWGMAFNIWRLAAVFQGIAARYAARQASSEKAKSHAMTREPMAKFAWQLAQEASGAAVSAKL
jgi:acyl-CoA dehydrogenase